MRGLRRVCKHCKTKFIPKRADAEFCCNLCRQAAYHKCKTVASAAEAATVFQERKHEALAIIDQFERYQSIAGALHQQAREGGYKVRFMATKIGILAVKGGDGLDIISHRQYRDLPRWFREIKTRSDSKEVSALLSLPSPFGAPYIAREAECEFRGARSELCSWSWAPQCRRGLHATSRTASPKLTLLLDHLMRDCRCQGLRFPLPLAPQQPSGFRQITS
jgi:hypothetical protein